ncbi:MAG TPA: ferritin [Chloroflexaceae bacterium]|nr:ferritin [Chloroflexaceae bacterium]
MNETIQTALNEQLALELSASHTYLAMAAYAEGRNLGGCARWMRLQSEEERAHALKIFDFIHDRDGQARLAALPEPAPDFGSVREMFEAALAHERKVTASINRIYSLAVQENDYPSQVLFQWFINEQVEEEKQITQILDQLKLVGAEGLGLYLIDRELAGRQPEAAGAGEGDDER